MLEKQRQWEVERHFLQSQLQYSQRQSEDNKRMHEALLTAINNKNSSEGEEQIILINKNLSEAIAQVEARCQSFQAKVAALKPFKRAMNQAESLQCANCQVFFKALPFLDHCRSCTQEVRRQRKHFFSVPLQLSIQQTRINSDPLDSR